MPIITIGANTTDDYGSVEDARMRESAPTAAGDDNTVTIIKYGAGAHENSLIRFLGLNNIPAGATINSVSMHLYMNAMDGAGITADIFESLRAWTENATWNTYDGTNAWNTPGSLGSGSDIGASALASVAIGSPEDVYKTFSGAGLTSLVQSLVSASSNALSLFLTRNGAGNDSQYHVFASSEDVDGVRPYLTVDYDVPADQTISPPLITSAAQIFAPVLTTANVIAVALITSAAVIYAPTIEATSGSGTPVTITIGANTTDDFAGVEDARIREATPTAAGDDNTVTVIKFAAGNHEHSLIRFLGLSNIPLGSTINSVSMHLYMNGMDGAGITVDIFESLRAWTENATWNTYDGTNAWNTPGSLGSGSDIGASALASVAIGAPEDVYKTFSGAGLTALVQSLVDSSSNALSLFLTRNGAGNDSQYHVFASSEDVDGVRPYLEIEYTASSNQYVAVPLLSSPAQIFAPSLNASHMLDFDASITITVNTTFAVTSPQTINVPVLTSTAQIFAPQIAAPVAQVITPALITSPAQIHAPIIWDASESLLVVPLLNSPATIFAPQLSQPVAQTIAPGVITSTAQIYAPVLAQQAITGDQSMTQSALIADLQGALKDAAAKFSAPTDFLRHLNVAAADLSRTRPFHKYASITLLSGVVAYDLPADLIAVVSSDWGRAERIARKPWDRSYPGRAPRARAVTTSSGKQLLLTPAPTASQLTDLGATYGYTYSALHVISDTVGATTVPASQRDLLLIRATAQALIELANNGINKPVELGQRGVGSMPKNGTPAALAEQLMKQFRESA